MGDGARDDGPRNVTVRPASIPSGEAFGTPTLFSWRDFDPASLEGAAKDLEAELVTYRDRLDEILANPGKYVVIKGDRIAGYHADRGEALAAAVAEFGRGPFLIKRVAEFQEPVRLGNVL